MGNRGGRRTGQPGRAYGNRTDLNTNRVLPVEAGPSQQYGQRAAQEAAQRAVPMATPAAPVGALAARQVAAPPAAPPPPLDAPTTRPNEPLTAGAELGAGPGPMAMGAPAQTLGDVMRSAAAAPFASSEVAALAAFIDQGRL